MKWPRCDELCWTIHKIRKLEERRWMILWNFCCYLCCIYHPLKHAWILWNMLKARVSSMVWAWTIEEYSVVKGPRMSCSFPGWKCFLLASASQPLLDRFGLHLFGLELILLHASGWSWTRISSAGSRDFGTAPRTSMCSETRTYWLKDYLHVQGQLL